MKVCRKRLEEESASTDTKAVLRRRWLEYELCENRNVKGRGA